MRSFILKRLALAAGTAALLCIGGAAAAMASDDSAEPLRATTAVVDAAARLSGDVAAPGVFDGKWIIVQSNGGTGQLFNGAPDSGGHYTGFAASSSGTARGDIQGQLNGDVVLFDIQWNFGHTGRYTGHRGFDGNWSGMTVDLNDPSSQATWFAYRG